MGGFVKKHKRTLTGGDHHGDGYEGPKTHGAPKIISRTLNDISRTLDKDLRLRHLQNPKRVQQDGFESESIVKLSFGWFSNPRDLIEKIKAYEGNERLQPLQKRILALQELESKYPTVYKNLSDDIHKLLTDVSFAEADISFALR